VERKLSDLQASLKREEIVLRNLDSFLEHEGFDLAAYSQKRNGRSDSPSNMKWTS
jgi:hypothetical protein